MLNLSCQHDEYFNQLLSWERRPPNPGDQGGTPWEMTEEEILHIE